MTIEITEIVNQYNISIEEVDSTVSVVVEEVIEEITVQDGGSGGSGGITDHTLLTSIGENTHPQLDAEKTASSAHRAGAMRSHPEIDSHLADPFIHFIQEDIDHTAINTGGSEYTHLQIDNHIDDVNNPHQVTADQVLPSQTGNSGKVLTTNGSEASWETPTGGGGGGSGLEYDQRIPTYTDGLLTQVVYKLLGTTVETMTITYDYNDRPLQYSFAVSGKVVDVIHLGTGFLSEVA